MNTDHHAVLYRRIIDSATEGFLTYGYHGYSMQACAQAVGLQKGSLYHYFDGKIDLAHGVMRTLLDEAKQSMVSNQSPFTLDNGLRLVVVPMRLWTAQESGLQACIRDYYSDWYFTFINQGYNRSYFENSDALYPAGHYDFLQWLGFWLAQELVFNPSEPDVIPLKPSGFLH